MKTELEETPYGLKIYTPDNQFIAYILVETGEIVNLGNLGNLGCTIDELYRFISAARTRYRKFMRSEEVESYKFD